MSVVEISLLMQFSALCRKSINCYLMHESPKFFNRVHGNDFFRLGGPKVKKIQFKYGE